MGACTCHKCGAFTQGTICAKCQLKEAIDRITRLSRGRRNMPWLCQCGTGELDTFNHEALPPEFCPLCNMNLWVYFGITEEGE